MSEEFERNSKRPLHRELTERDVRGPKADSEELRAALARANENRLASAAGGPLSIARPIDNPRRRELFERMQGVVSRIVSLEAKRLGLPQVDLSFIESGSTNVSDDLWIEGLYNPLTDVTNVRDQGTKSTVTLFATLLHETVHRASRSDFVLDDKSFKPSIHLRKIGLSSSKQLGSTREHWFEGLNEGVVEGYTRFLIQEYRDLIMTALPEVTKDELSRHREASHVYDSVVSFVDSMVHTLASEGKVPAQKKWDDVVRAHFAAELMWTRDIERRFGPGSVDILSTIRPEGVSSVVAEYFAETDPDARIRKGLQLRVGLAPVTDYRLVLRYLKSFRGNMKYRALTAQALEQLIARCEIEEVSGEQGNSNASYARAVSLTHYKKELETLQR